MDLSIEEVAGDALRLKGWKTTQEFDTFAKYLEAAYTDWSVRLVNEVGSDKSDYYRGIIHGLKIALQIPENVELLWASLKDQTLNKS